MNGRFTTTALLTLLWSVAVVVVVHAKEEEVVLDGEEFDFFLAHNDTMTCAPNEDAQEFDGQIYGVNLGGWMVLEPWITPSLFYQFLGGSNENNTAMDMYTFCKVLGPQEANRQLRRHWESWVTKDIIKKLKEEGGVNSLRLPVGDWMYKPYGPYVGCTDGALEYVDHVLDWAKEFELGVLFDVHGVIDSQNGFDNSGQSRGTKWTTNTWPPRFEHWPLRKAEWMGTFDIYKNEYVSINHDNIIHTIEALVTLVMRYKDHPAVFGVAPVNEPWEKTPIDLLKKYYWDGYLIVKELAPSWKYVIHDSFRFSLDIWGNFMKGCPDKILDTHIYQAWSDPNDKIGFYCDACSWKTRLEQMEEAFGPVVVGEWSLATDNCAMWLNGFNDNVPGFPKLPCKYIPCGESYLGPDQPGVPLAHKSAQGPFGMSGQSTPLFGYCPVDRDWTITHSRDPRYPDFPQAPSPKVDETDIVMTQLAHKKLHTYTTAAHGFYFWNFRTDLNEPQWNYLLAVERGWIVPLDNDNKDPIIDNACVKEDQAGYTCIAVRGAPQEQLKNGVQWVINVRNSTHIDMDNLTYDEMLKLSDEYYNSWYTEHNDCGFGGTAKLIDKGDEWRSWLVRHRQTIFYLEVAGVMILVGMGLFILGGKVHEKYLRETGALRDTSDISGGDDGGKVNMSDGKGNYQSIASSD